MEQKCELWVKPRTNFFFCANKRFTGNRTYVHYYQNKILNHYFPFFAQFLCVCMCKHSLEASLSNVSDAFSDINISFEFPSPFSFFDLFMFAQEKILYFSFSFFFVIVDSRFPHTHTHTQCEMMFSTPKTWARDKRVIKKRRRIKVRIWVWIKYYTPKRLNKTESDTHISNYWMFIFYSLYSCRQLILNSNAYTRKKRRCEKNGKNHL